jgi:hypothetical protein
MTDPPPRSTWTGPLIAGTIVLFLLAVILAVVPLTECPRCYGTGIKDGIFTISAPITQEYAERNPCLACDGWPPTKMSFLKRWLIIVRKD